MESIDPKCTALKKSYEACFNAWYAERFLPGRAVPGTDDDTPCGPLFRQYRACIDGALLARGVERLIEEHRAAHGSIDDDHKRAL